MSQSSLQSSIFLNEARSETLTNQITDNSSDLRLLQKYASNDIQNIRDKYAPEKDRIQNEIASLDKIEDRDEYVELATELNDLKEAENREVEKIEKELNEKETEVQFENETLEVQLEAVNADIESFEEMLKEAVEKNFGYFQ